ncbi:MAG: TIGR03960 family B12-binding radical SAM protein [Desulfobacteraceae bacterium]|nr:TIGR03960 family B12-binding radical SAM protein [Desulfobacteraceae bacterium]
MHKQNYQDILAQVQTPTRYAGNEINAVKKDLDQVDLTFGLIFPDLYEIGTSHFGLQILYSILNQQENIAAERFFAPAPDMEQLMEKHNIPCLSMESQKELASFDIIGISLLYELNFTNILTLLSLSKIPFYADKRDETFPLIIGGGPCAFNPEPLADFFDAFVIGDGEEVVKLIANQVIEFKKQGDGNKKNLLRLLSKITGVYIPSFFTPQWDGAGIQTLIPLYEDYTKIKRAFLPELSLDNFPMDPIVPYAKPVHDRLRLEIARGCSRGCRFCQAGIIYRPVRERSTQDLLTIAKASLKSTGYSEMSLLSLSTGDYSNLSRLMQQLLTINPGQCNSISLPSIRAEKLTPELMQLIKTVRKTGFTIAPEAGTQRLRDIINKNLTEESIDATVKNALELGWKNIKLYFMMGLPFEEMADLEGICRLSTHLAAAYAKGKKNINVSVTSFIPKAHTPFQRHSQMTLSQTKEKLQYLKDNLRHKKTKLKWQDPQMSLLEGVWARGDRKLAPLLVAAFENGCRLDGWTDHFNFNLWQKAFDDTGIDPLFYTSRKRSEDEPLPWDHIDSGVTDTFFKKEFQKAKEKSLTLDCREHDCSGCGVCNFKTIQPVIHGEQPIPQGTPVPLICPATQLPDDAFFKFDLIFSKLDKARFFGHLELATIIQRAIKRAGLTVKYSQGFNPSMRLSFENALPLGMESEEETAFIFLEKGSRPEEIKNALNKVLPTGLNIIDCRHHSKFRQEDNRQSAYRIRFSTPCMDQKKIEQFLELSEFMVEDISKKGKIRKTDLRQAVQTICPIDQTQIEMVLKQYNERNIRPTEVLAKYFNIDEGSIKTARIKKIKQG